MTNSDNKFQNRCYALVPQFKELDVLSVQKEGYLQELIEKQEGTHQQWSCIAMGFYASKIEDKIKLVADPYVGRYLNDNELKAVLLHELAHIVNNDMEKSLVAEDGVSIANDIEIAADRYATDNGANPEALWAGFMKLSTVGNLRFSKAIMEKFTRLDRNNIVAITKDIFNTNPDLQERFKSLFN